MMYQDGSDQNSRSSEGELLIDVEISANDNIHIGPLSEPTITIRFKESPTSNVLDAT